LQRHLSPIDLRPFQAKSALDLQHALEQHYRRVAIPEVAAALSQRAPKTPAVEGKPAVAAKAA
jgi:hypothetical protein